MSARTKWEEITSFRNLCSAARRAARGKKTVAGAAKFLERLEIEVLALQRELIADTWRPSRPATFTIHDPKERVITAAPFHDRVVHHALVDPLEAIFDAALVPETFACRRGKGTHKALAHAKDLVRGNAYFLKLDVRKCFDSIQHAVVIDTLAALDLEAEVMALAMRVLGGVPCTADKPGAGRCAGYEQGRLGVGLPIGNLTSQWFANLVLGRLDRFVLGELRVRGYVRYMDDFVLFGDEKQELKAAQLRIAGFLRAELHLDLKERATILAPAREGLPFLGWRIHRGIVRIRPENLRRLRRRVRHRRWEQRTGRIDERTLTAALSSVIAHISHGDTLALRRAWLCVSCDELGSGSPAHRTA
jgi:RNA-directed DNA polymerase